MSDFTTSQLLDLKARLLPFGTGWTRESGRDLATVRDGIDFLTAMRGRDDFWAALEPRHPTEPYAVDLTAVRAILPSAPETSGGTEADYLQSLGLSDEEVAAVAAEIDAPDLVDGAIRSAFALGEPQKVARALEGILETAPDVVATQQYMRQVKGSRALVQSLSAVMGIALLLVGTGCSSQGGPTQVTTSAPPVTSTEAPTTSSSVASSTTDPPAPTPPSASTTAPATPPPAPPTPKSPRRPRSPTVKYKGVSPRRRAQRPVTPR